MAAFAHIEYAVIRALSDLNVHEKEQIIDIRNVQDGMLDGANMRYVFNFIRRNLNHNMERLSLLLDCGLSDEAIEMLRAFLVQTTLLQKIRLSNATDLEDEECERLLSGLHGNPSVKEIGLRNIGLEGEDGGAILAALLLNVPGLKSLICGYLPLGPEGTRALQPGIRGNQTLDSLALDNCQLGDTGLLAIVEALEGNITIAHVGLDGNGITSSDGLPHLTRLLQHSSVKEIDLDNNPGLFDNAENSRLFASAFQNAKLKLLSLCFCRLPGRAVIAIFQAAAMNKNLSHLYVYDRVRLEGEDLESLLEIIPTMPNLLHLGINLDFTNQAVLSAFHLNPSIQYLYNANMDEIKTGPVFEILKRNRRLRKASDFLDSEPQRAIPLGLWAKAIEHLTRDKSGATAAFKILRGKLVVWRASSMPSTSSTVKRLHAQALMDNDDKKMEAKSSSSLLDREQKRQRGPKSTGKESSTTALMMESDTVNIDSLSREELIEMIHQKNQKIAEQADTIAMLVSSKTTEGEEEEE